MVNTVLVCWLIDTACRTRATAWLNTEYGSIRYKCNIKNNGQTQMSNIQTAAEERLNSAGKVNRYR